jgi:hypothetical protein
MLRMNTRPTEPFAHWLEDAESRTVLTALANLMKKG